MLRALLYTLNLMHGRSNCASVLGTRHNAVQGFLPEAADQFAQDVVYPSFSPTVGIFLLLSTAYGIWKVCAPLTVLRL